MISDEKVYGLNALASRLTQFVNSITREEVDRVNTYLWLHRKGDIHFHDSPKDMIVVLADARYQPKSQLYISCALEGTCDLRFTLPEFPFNIDIVHKQGLCRLGGEWLNLSFITSDELSLKLLDNGDAHEWAIVPLAVAELPDSVSLLSLTVLGCGREFVVKARPSASRVNRELAFVSMLRAQRVAAAAGGANGSAIAPQGVPLGGDPGALDVSGDEGLDNGDLDGGLGLDSCASDVASDVMSVMSEAGEVTGAALEDELGVCAPPPPRRRLNQAQCVMRQQWTALFLVVQVLLRRDPSTLVCMVMVPRVLWSHLLRRRHPITSR